MMRWALKDLARSGRNRRKDLVEMNQEVTKKYHFEFIECPNECHKINHNCRRLVMHLIPIR